MFITRFFSLKWCFKMLLYIVTPKFVSLLTTEKQISVLFFSELFFRSLTDRRRVLVVEKTYQKRDNHCCFQLKSLVVGLTDLSKTAKVVR